MPEDSTPSPSQAPIPLAAFATTLRPRLTASRTVQSRQPGARPSVINTYSPGDPDEIWLKLLEVNHRIERHTSAEWRALIAKYKDEPAHPADPNYGVGA
jgi:hypothetical protein